jgi:CheY-like chemotaxis protein
VAGRENTVLVIEDDPSTAQLISEVLKSAGYRSLHAREGAEALRLIRERHPDMITLDLALPGIDGRSFLLSLRSDEQTKRTPVIVVSANSENLNAFERRSVTRVLPKPFDLDDLVTAVRSVAARDGVAHA